MAKFTMTSALTAILAGIAAGSITHVAKSKDIDALVGEGLIEVNPTMLDANGNAAVRLTDKGKAAAPAPTAPADNAPVFAFSAQEVELPPIKRGGNSKPRESKYPLKDIPLGRALFIQAEDGKEPKQLTKQFGSVVADFNKKNPDRYLTTRFIEDGKAAGFSLPDNPDAFDGKPGIGIYHRPVSERPVRKPRKTADATAGEAASA